MKRGFRVTDTSHRRSTRKASSLIPAADLVRTPLPQAGRALKARRTKHYFFETISPIFGLGAAKELMCASEA